MRRRHVIPILIGLVAAAAAFMETHAYGLFGFDSYPILLTSRVQNVHDFIGNFTEELMDGRFEGHFYRPLLNLSFALDTAIWKLNPTGFQLTNALLFGACVAITFVLARTLLGSRAWFGPGIAALVFFLHPTQVEVLPVPSRRPEMLAWCFGAAAVVTTLTEKRRWLPALLSFLAMLSKETAFLLPAWIFVTVALTRRNLKESIHATAPHLLALAVAMGMRLAVLHGLGGYENTSLAGSLSRVPVAFVVAVKWLLIPQPPLRAGLGGVPILLVCLIVAAVLVFTLTRGVPGRRDPEGSEAKHSQDAILAGAFWIVAVGLSTSLAGHVASWYVLLMVGGWALVLGGLAETGWRGARVGNPTARWAGRGLLLITAVLTLWPAFYSPFIHHYREWDEATAQSRTFLTELDRRIQIAENGSVIPSPPIPRWAKTRPDAVAVRGAALFSGMTLDAYFELAYPARHIRLARTGKERPVQDAVLIVPTGFAPGFDGP